MIPDFGRSLIFSEGVDRYYHQLVPYEDFKVARMKLLLSVVILFETEGCLI
jgi:hypothetical protein